MNSLCLQGQALIKKHQAIICLFVLLLTGCALEVPRVVIPSPLAPVAGGHSQTIRFAEEVSLVLPTLYSRKIKKGSEWEFVGDISEGQVYKPIRSVFTVEGAHVHEAYLVISGASLVGFYLPVEKAITAIKPIENLPIKIDGETQ